MDVDRGDSLASPKSPKSPKSGGVAESKQSEAGEEKEGGAAEPEAPQQPPEPEPTSFKLGNPARVTPGQEPLVSFELNQRYVPVRRAAKPIGIVMLVDQNPEVSALHGVWSGLEGGWC
jgi:hypothetical protein